MFTMRKLFLVFPLFGLGAFFYFYPFLTSDSLPHDVPLLDSANLLSTIIVPTLDAPRPEGKNVLWCSSFQLAWNRLRSDVVKEPISLEGAEEIAESLNKNQVSEENLDPKAYYAAAGYVKDGIVAKICRDMASRFPEVSPKDLENEFQDQKIVVYSYLAASVKFSIPFFDNKDPLPFTDSSGKKIGVTSFGIRPEDEYAYKNLRQQVGILYQIIARDFPFQPEEFAIDPCQESMPNQLILARIPAQKTLTECLVYLEKKIRPDGKGYSIGINDSLLIPSMNWKIRNNFPELEKKSFLNPVLKGQYIDKALQTIRFQLNRGGADLASEAKILAKPQPSHFHLDKPFLLVMNKRGSQRPFLVMWVDNAELLVPFKEE